MRINDIEIIEDISCPGKIFLKKMKHCNLMLYWTSPHRSCKSLPPVFSTASLYREAKEYLLTYLLKLICSTLSKPCRVLPLSHLMWKSRNMNLQERNKKTPLLVGLLREQERHNICQRPWIALCRCWDPSSCLRSWCLAVVLIWKKKKTNDT